MYRVLVLYSRPDDPDHFRDYYVGTHLPLAAALPGLVSSRYTFDVRSPHGDPPFFCIWKASSPTRPRSARRCSPTPAPRSRPMSPTTPPAAIP
ncbi:MAG: EthD family reductase [Sphingomonas sp.]